MLKFPDIPIMNISNNIDVSSRTAMDMKPKTISVVTRKDHVLQLDLGKSPNDEWRISSNVQIYIESVVNTITIQGQPLHSVLMLSKEACLAFKNDFLATIY